MIILLMSGECVVQYTWSPRKLDDTTRSFNLPWRDWGRQSLPKIFIILVVVAGFAGNHHQKRGFLGGLAAFQTSLRGQPRNSCK